jgi:hypothetical protein
LLEILGVPISQNKPKYKELAVNKIQKRIEKLRRKYNVVIKKDKHASDKQMLAVLEALDKKAKETVTVTPRPNDKSIPLSKASKKAGVKWLMVCGVTTAKEARRMEKIFVESLKNITPEQVQDARAKMKELQDKLNGVSTLLTHVGSNTKRAARRKKMQKTYPRACSIPIVT